MIDYQKKIDFIQDQYSSEPMHIIDSHFDELSSALLDAQQYSDLCNLYYIKTVFYYQNGLTLKSLNLLIEHREFLNKYALKQDQVRIHLTTAVLLDSLGYDTSYLQSMKDIMAKAKHLGMHKVVSDVLNNIGYYYFEREQFEVAEEIFLECLEFLQSHPELLANQTYVIVILNLMELYVKTEQLEKLTYYLDVIKSGSDIKHPMLFISFLNIKIQHAKLLQDWTLAQQYIDDLLAYEPESMENSSITQILIDIAEVYECAGLIDNAVDMMERSIKYTEKLDSHIVTQYSIESHHGLEKTAMLENLYEDSLTGVLNRTGFEKYVTDSLQKSANRWQFFGLLDIDYFKQINDEYGHLVGDEVLKEVCKRAKRYAISHRDHLTVFFGRFGGDEFYLYLETQKENQLHEFAIEFYEQLIAQPFQYESITFPISISFGGISTFNNPYSFTELFTQADEEMYKIKRTGRGHMQITQLFTN